MTVTIWINNKKYRLGFEAGWFKGQDCKLLGLTLFEHMRDLEQFMIINISILRFDISLWVETVAG